jgi:hypothetical protein
MRPKITPGAMSGKQFGCIPVSAGFAAPARWQTIVVDGRPYALPPFRSPAAQRLERLAVWQSGKQVTQALRVTPRQSVGSLAVWRFRSVGRAQSPVSALVVRPQPLGLRGVAIFLAGQAICFASQPICLALGLRPGPLVLGVTGRPLRTVPEAWPADTAQGKVQGLAGGLPAAWLARPSVYLVSEEGVGSSKITAPDPLFAQALGAPPKTTSWVRLGSPTYK